MKNSFLTILTTLFIASTPAINAADFGLIKLAEDLAQDASVSLSQNKPIVFFVTANHCPYCEKLRHEYFRFSPGDERFILRELELDEHHSVVGFDGKKTNHRALSKQYKISLTPTVAFVGPDGKQLADSIIGVPLMDFYNYYFEKALDESIAQLREKSRGIAEN
jgi:thioredoxin-related protein